MNLDELHGKGWIDRHKPLWWDLDYKPDPRELVDSDEFVRRTVNLGNHWYPLKGLWNNPDHAVFEDFILYEAEKVPIVLIDVQVDSENATLFATARPYNESEVRNAGGLFEEHFPLDTLIKTIESSDEWIRKCQRRENVGDDHPAICFLSYHFFPHVRGLLKERVGNHFFWYPISHPELAASVRESLGELRDFFRVWEYPIDSAYTATGCKWYEKVGSESMSYESPRHRSAKNELKSKRLICGKTPVVFDTSDMDEVAYDEFVEGLKSKKQMVSVYPVRHSDVDETIPVVLSTRTHKESKRREATVLGVMGNYSHRDRYKIWRITDQVLCRDISKTLKDELKTDFAVVHFIDGRYKLVNVS